MSRKKKPEALGKSAPADNGDRKKRARRTTDEQEAARLAKSHDTRRAKRGAWKERFLRALKAEKSVTKACEAASISRATAYEFRDLDENFARLWDESLEVMRDNLEAGAMRRADDGWLEPVYYKGQVVGTVRKFSAALTIFMLKCHRPDRYNLFFPEDDGGEGTPEQRAKKVRDALKAMRSSVPLAPEDESDGTGSESES